MSKHLITQTRSIDTFFFGRCSPSFFGFSLNPESAFIFDSEEQADAFVENNGLLDVKSEPLSNYVQSGGNDAKV